MCKTTKNKGSLRRKINSFYRQKNNNPESNLLSGYKFCVSGEIKKDDSLTLDLFETIFNNDGQIFMPLHDGDYIISKDQEDANRLASTIDLTKIKLVKYDDFIKQVNKAKMRLSEVD